MKKIEDKKNDMIDIMKSKDYKALHSVTGGDITHPLTEITSVPVLDSKKGLGLGFMETSLRIASHSESWRTLLPK